MTDYSQNSTHDTLHFIQNEKSRVCSGKFQDFFIRNVETEHF